MTAERDGEQRSRPLARGPSGRARGRGRRARTHGARDGRSAALLLSGCPRAQCRVSAVARAAVLAEKRLLGGAYGPPHLVAVVPLHEGLRGPAPDALRLLRSNAANLVVSEVAGAHGFALLCPRLRQRWRFVSARAGDFHVVLDLAKVADTLLFVLHPEDGWDSAGENGLSCLFAQGLPTLVVQGMADLPPKKQTEAKKKLSKATEKRFPEAKLFLWNRAGVFAAAEASAYLLAHAAEFVSSQESNLVGTLKVSGFIWGQPLNVSSLVHIVGHRDFQMSQVDVPPDPLCLNPRAAKRLERKGQDMEIQSGNSAVQMEEDVKVLMKADPSRQELLQSEVVPDPIKGEQTWPTEEELKEAEESVKERKKTVKVPKGTSKYQAAWIVDDEEDGSEEDEDGDSMEEDDLMEEEAFQVSDEEEEPVDEECETMTLPESARDDQYDERVEEDEQVPEKYRQERTDEMFPDEVDTPRDMPARVRFEKYRGLKSFRTSPWDPKENLPRDYARIFQCQDFSRTRKHVFRQLEKEEIDGAAVGWYVTLHISSVPVSVMESFRQGKPLVLFSLLPHEQKVNRSSTLMTYSHTGGQESCCWQEGDGFPTWLAQAWPSGLVDCLTSLPGAGMHDLLATGSLLTVDPDRLIIKRLVLSGHPLKIFSKMAVVRYMFFKREDVLWFKPVELRTKWGRRGHIKEPLGTPGHMKCHFAGQLKSQDTVLMNLYKCIFPKWTWDPYVPEPVPWVRNAEPLPVPEVDME
uniref:Pre-rRNA-processing protein TSR1 homolog n=1 Tax=Crocodylus porosus TaxID=8502 RepID=A0A7M4FEP0_CROPO